MWIYSEKSVINTDNYDRFYIEEPHAGDDSISLQYYLMGGIKDSDKGECCLFQSYSTYENARRALSRLVGAIEENKTVFRVPKEEDLGFTHEEFIQEYLRSIKE